MSPPEQIEEDANVRLAEARERRRLQNRIAQRNLRKRRAQRAQQPPPPATTEHHACRGDAQSLPDHGGEKGLMPWVALTGPCPSDNETCSESQPPDSASPRGVDEDAWAYPLSSITISEPNDAATAGPPSRCDNSAARRDTDLDLNIGERWPALSVELQTLPKESVKDTAPTSKFADVTGGTTPPPTWHTGKFNLDEHLYLPTPAPSAGVPPTSPKVPTYLPPYLRSAKHTPCKLAERVLAEHKPTRHKDEGKRLLHLCAERGHAKIVALLVREGADVDIIDGMGRTALHYAASHGHVEIVEALLCEGVDPDVADEEGFTPLHVAGFVGNENIVSMLIRSGADPDASIHPRRS